MLNHADFILGPHLIITVLLLNYRYYPLVAQYESVILSCKLYLHSQYCQNLVCVLPNFNCVERWGQSCFWFSCAINLQSGLGSLGQINVPLSFLHYRITLICKEIKHFSFLLLLAFVVFHFFSLWKVSFFSFILSWNTVFIDLRSLIGVKTYLHWSLKDKASDWY